MSYRTKVILEGEEPGPLIDLSNWEIPRSAYAPASLLTAIMVIAWISHSGSNGMRDWGVSAFALGDGHYETIPLHMIAHAGLAHLSFNALALVQIGGPLATCLGTGWKMWLRFIALTTACGLAGMLVFLAAHPSGSTPMIGASGAIFGLLGLLLRIGDGGRGVVPLFAPQMKKGALEFVKSNIFLILILTVPALLLGVEGGVAWEAHLGGFMFGALIGPKFISRANGQDPPDEDRGMATSA